MSHIRKMEHTVKQVADFLGGHYGEQISDVAPLSGGNWSQAFAFKRNGKHYVIRLGRHVKDYHKDQVAARFTSPALPIPQVLEIGEAFDDYFAISEQAFGEMLDQLDATKMQKIVPAVLAMLDAMRQVDLSGNKGYGAWDDKAHAPHKTWQDYLLQVGVDDPASRTYGWRAKLAASPIGDNAFNTGVERLEQLVGICPNEKHLIHTDLLNSNAMAQDNHISAVFDWGNALCGDSLHDLACFSYWSKWFHSMHGIDWEAEAKQHFAATGIEVANFDERLRCYKLHISLEHQAYNAFTENWDELKINTTYMMELL
jgi:hygromycin-B 4-O-kinase